MANSLATPLTLADGFNATPVGLPNTFAINPNFLVGYAQTWNASIQRDLPGGMIMNVSYARQQGDAGRAGVLSQYLSGPGGVPLSHLSFRIRFTTLPTEIPRANPARSNCGAGSITASPRARNIPIPNRLTTPVLGGRGSGRPGSCPELARSQRRTWAFAFRPKASGHFFGAIHQRHGHARRNAVERLARRRIERLDPPHQYHGGQRPARNAHRSSAAESPARTSSDFGRNTPGPMFMPRPAGLALNPVAYAAPPSGDWGNAGRDSITGPVAVLPERFLAAKLR